MRTARRQVVARDGAVCRRCGKPIDLTLSGRHPMGLTLGHIVAVAEGGSDELANLAPEHHRCNLGAGDVAPRARVAISPFCGPGR
jgi:5-methylcytosine-specific restriction endonuclease McrA